MDGTGTRAIGGASELRISTRRADGSLRNPITIWVVRDGDDIYVRGYRGRSTTWFRNLLTLPGGHIRAGGVDRDVVFTEETDAAVNDRIDEAYRSKYRRYPDLVAPEVIETISHRDAEGSTRRSVGANIDPASSAGNSRTEIPT
ncbi:MAG: DUF2255 family protein [Thermomicrobiales bacterium]